MNAFDLQTTDSTLQLRLAAEVTIEHARPLHAELLPRLAEAGELLVDASAITAVHPAVLQVLLAAALKLPLRVSAGSDAWYQALERLGLGDTILTPRSATSSSPAN